MGNKHTLEILFTDGKKLTFTPKEWDNAQIEGGIALVVYKDGRTAFVAPIRNFFYYEIYKEEEK